MTYIIYGGLFLIGLYIAMSIPWERVGKWGCMWIALLVILLAGLVLL